MPELRDRTVTRYVRDVGQAARSRGDRARSIRTRSPLPICREINAFALPGGPVWINRGVLEQGDERVASGGRSGARDRPHRQRHGADRLTQGMVAKWGLGLLGALLGNTGGAGGAQAAAEFLTGGVFLKFSRDEEREADEWGWS